MNNFYGKFKDILACIHIKRNTVQGWGWSGWTPHRRGFEWMMGWIIDVTLYTHIDQQRWECSRLSPDMEAKIIYFTVNGRPEQAEFPTDCPAQDIKGKDCLKWYISSSLTTIVYFFF